MKRKIKKVSKIKIKKILLLIIKRKEKQCLMLLKIILKIKQIKKKKG